jgi:hypothetical protein
MPFNVVQASVLEDKISSGVRRFPYQSQAQNDSTALIALVKHGGFTYII